jgi:FG-GAP repeat
VPRIEGIVSRAPDGSLAQVEIPRPRTATAATESTIMNISSSFAFLAACALTITPAFAQSKLFTFSGDSAGDVFSWSVSDAGDVNGDGFADLIAGAPQDKITIRRGYARVFSGRDGSVLYTFTGDGTGDTFGRRVAGAGDVNRDGYDDLIVGASQERTIGRKGYARVYSGKDGSTLGTIRGDSNGDLFGHAVSGSGDFNRDGWSDVVVGAAGGGKNGGGYIRVFSGRTGGILGTFHGDAKGNTFGRYLSFAGDVNKDGYDDVIAGAKFGGKNNGGYVRVISGRDGSTLYTIHGDSAGDESSRVGAADVDNDGHADLIIGAAGDDNNGSQSGSVRVISGKSGKNLYNLNGDRAYDYFGSTVAGTGDLNRDGFEDFVVGAVVANTNTGYARVFSGKDGKELYTFRGKVKGDRFGHVRAAGDVNADGISDFVVGAPQQRATPAGKGYATVFSGSALPLITDKHRVSVSTKGSQLLTLNAGPTHANKTYFLLGTLSGTKPGLPLGNSVTLPLNIDPYFMVTLDYPNSPLLSSSMGRLDSAGKASARFNVIPQIPVPPMSGFRLEHAFVVIGNSSFDMASNAVPLTLVK